MSGPGTMEKCVILARGLGTRMRRDDAATELDTEQLAAASSGLKAMIPIGRPFLDYVLSALADAVFQKACLVIGPEHTVVREYYARLRPTRIDVTFAVQAEALGTANAVLAAEKFVANDEFLVMNSDNYYPVEVLQAMQGLGQAGTVLFEAAALVRNSNVPPERIRDFAYALIDDDGYLADLVEKPDAQTAARFESQKLVSMNCWRFGPSIFPICRDVPLSARGEYELPLAVKLAIQRGMKFKVTTSQAGCSIFPDALTSQRLPSVSTI
jgi:dTDP-glucose pyrophosphorylase